MRAEEVAYKRHSHDLKKYMKKYGKNGNHVNSKAPPPPTLVRPHVSRSLLSLTSLKGLSSFFQINQSNIEIVVLPIHLLILLFFLPILDVVFVTISRIISGHSPFYPDRTHLHHLFFDKGLSQKRTVIFIYSVTQLCVCIGINLNNIKGNYSLILYSLIFLVTMIFLIFPKSNFSLFKK